ncbi:nitric oxide synthase, inducible-like [Parasteatoda tepidariorum]|uniref:nitric oxide synthase, inducible-like n=1 Tax=Parasteatoda tepidariorum TaxID=114398 RepID=UPI00077FBD5C|nr:nitric oxide synthase, inducible-like [Parasteatoda tepidariorum]
MKEKLGVMLDKLKSDLNLNGSINKPLPDKVESRCPFIQSESEVKLTNFVTGKKISDSLHTRSKPITCSSSSCKGALMSGQSSVTVCDSKKDILKEALQFQEEYFASLKNTSPEDFRLRVKEIEEEIYEKGTYTLTSDELSFGAKLAWRNASRCIGRIQWSKLELFDRRDVTSTREMYSALCTHLEYATNGGNIRSAITLFPPRVEGREDFRVWNPQLINYAGYLQPDGSVIGDPGRVQLTRICQRLGWRGKGGRFDILPWVVSAPNEGVKYYEVPEELILMVKLEHPKYKWFEELDIKWYAVPAVADMMLDIGGIQFTAAPFNGWYMATEIGARNLCDPYRFNMMEEVAEKLGLDTRTPTTLWKDMALLETTLAVLYSFQKNKVTIVDHHTAAETFMKHMETEQKLRGGCPADWVWIVPPISGSATPVFHQEMITYNLKPSYEYQEKAWVTYKWPVNDKVKLKFRFRSVAKAVQICIRMINKVKSSRTQATILYATETGKSETFAKKLGQMLQASFNTQVICMEDYDFEKISSEQFVAFVSSTFGSGEPPDNGKTFWKALYGLKAKGHKLQNLRYAVFALGSSQYPHFCQFGKDLDKCLSEIGAKRLMPVEMGDELGGQEHVFKEWLPKAYKASCEDFGIPIDEEMMLESINSSTWKPGQFRMIPIKNKVNVLSGLSQIHTKQVFTAKMLTKMNLQSESSDRKTLLIKLDVQNNSILAYEPGDHIAIFPTNPASVVDPILEQLDCDVDSIFKTEHLKGGEWKRFTRLPAASLKILLRHYLDVTTPPTCSFLRLLSELASNKWDKFRLKRLSEVHDDYEAWKSHRHPNLAEVLEEFPSIKLDPTILVSELPLLQPRYYSISSSRLATPHEVHVTCALVSFRTQDDKGPLKHGVCTSFLDKAHDVEIPFYIRHAPRFRLPDIPSEPFIMVGAGSGIAPFRSFWLERDAMKHKSMDNHSNTTFGKMYLFFGCRQSTVDNLCSEEIATLVEKGVITKVFYAFSREPGQDKEYVQHKLEAEPQIVLDVLENDGHIYVCGDAVMAADVRATINKILEHSDKIHSLDDLLETGKYHEDVFGVLKKKPSIA